MLHLRTSAALLAALSLCLGAGCDPACDADGDGICAPDDCNDADPSISPEAPELCNGLDDNCNGGLSRGEIDDLDEDGVVACEDCDDTNPESKPGSDEICDGEDNDCDGTIRADETDSDGDGFLGCEECDDTLSTVFPGATEVCDGSDTDCDGVLPPTETDQDDDGFLECNGDCDPNREQVFPGAEEVCDGRDNDCDGVQLPEELEDGDGDGHPPCTDCDDTDFSVSPDVEEICDGIDTNCDGEDLVGDDGESLEKDDDEDGVLGCDGDCDDEDPDIFPGAFEILDNTLDDDCSGMVDDQPGWTPYFDDEATLLAQLSNECGWHWRAPHAVPFDEPPGVVTTHDGLTFSAELGGNPVDVVFADAVAPYAGSGYLTTAGPVDSMTVAFGELQDFVVYAASVENPAQWGDYSIEIFQFGASLIDGPMFGDAPTAGWNVRAASSHWNLGYDEMVFRPATSGEVVLLDELRFCR